MELPMTRPSGVNPASSTRRNSFTVRSDVNRRRPPEISVSFSLRRASSGNCCWGISVTILPLSALRQHSVERPPRLLRPLCLFGERGHELLDPLRHRYLFGGQRYPPDPSHHRACDGVVFATGSQHHTRSDAGEVQLD